MTLEPTSLFFLDTLYIHLLLKLSFLSLVSSRGGVIVDVSSPGKKIIGGKNSAVTSSFLQCDSSGAWSLISVVEGGWGGRDHQGTPI